MLKYECWAFKGQSEKDLGISSTDSLLALNSSLGVDNDNKVGYTEYAKKKRKKVYRGGVIIRRGKVVSNGKRTQTDSLIDNVFPPYDPFVKHGSEAHRLALDWAYKADTKAGDMTLISYHDRWYLVQKFDDADSKYLIRRRVLKAEFEKVSKEIEENGKSGDISSIQRRLTRNDKRNKSGYSFKERESSVDRDVIEHRREGQSVVRMVTTESDGRERSGRDGGGDREGSGQDRQWEGSERELTQEDREAYAAFTSELGAHMSEAILGNEDFIDRVVRSDASLTEKVIGKIRSLKEAFARIGDAEAQAQHKRLVEAEKRYLKAIKAAGYQYRGGKVLVSEEEKENTAEGGVIQEADRVKYSLKIKHTDGSIEELADARSLTEEQAKNYLKQAKTGALQGHTYIPVRKDTPQVIIDTLKQVNENVDDYSLVMQVGKARQAMSTEKSGSRRQKRGNNVRKHGLGPKEIVTIMSCLDDPTAIIYQTNRVDKSGKDLPNNVAVVVEYSVSGNESIAVIEFDSSIPAETIGLEQGDTRYHTVVTVFEPDTMRDDVAFDYVSELLSNPNNILLTIERGQPARSATREKHPNTSSKLPSNPIISKNSEMSTPKPKFSLKEKGERGENKKSNSYTKEEARAMVDKIMEVFVGEGYHGKLPGKRTEAIDRAHMILNSAEPGKRGSAALDFADYILRHAVLEDTVDVDEVAPYMEKVDQLKPYLRRLNLEELRDEIRHHYDTDRSLQWCLPVLRR